MEEFDSILEQIIIEVLVDMKEEIHADLSGVD